MKALKMFLAAVAFLGAGVTAKADNIVEIAVADGRFNTLVAAVQAAGLAETLSGPGPFTVFAPTDDAFAALPPGTVETLLEPGNLGQLRDILLYHVDDRLLPSQAFPHGTITIRPINSANVLCITNTGSGVTIGSGASTTANVIIADIQADNGVIHVIDSVLLPPRARCRH